MAVWIDNDYVLRTLLQLLAIPSPSGFTDQIVHHVGRELTQLSIPFELTRRGAIRANLYGRVQAPDRAIVSHLDTLGALVKDLKPDGRLSIVPIGTWSARFAEGARVTIITDHRTYRGTILPLKASGHTFHTEIDTQEVSWTNLEVRIDEIVRHHGDLIELGFRIGDFIAIDPNPEVSSSGFINSRHLDNKAGVAAMLAAARAVMASGEQLPLDCHLLFTISEEVGSGASAGLHQDVAEMVSVDNGTQAPGQNSGEFGVTVAMADSTGPFDYHLTRHLLDLCAGNSIVHQRDVFRYYRCDSASAVEAGNDIRTALVCFGIDASHGYERTHIDSIVSVARLLAHYMLSEPLFARDRQKLGTLSGFPKTQRELIEEPAEAAPIPERTPVTVPD